MIYIHIYIFQQKWFTPGLISGSVHPSYNSTIPDLWGELIQLLSGMKPQVKHGFAKNWSLGRHTCIFLHVHTMILCDNRGI